MWALEEEMFVAVRRTEHVEVTSRAVEAAPAKESAAPGPMTVRVFCDDYDATDSSGDDEDAEAIRGATGDGDDVKLRLLGYKPQLKRDLS